MLDERAAQTFSNEENNMWKILDLDDGIWVDLGSFSTIAEAEQNISRFKRGEDSVYAFWDGPISSDKAEQDIKAEEIINVNRGRILRTTIGLKPGDKEVGVSACSGNCFCVIANGSRDCETKYCNSNGWCWWVSCGSSC